MPRFYDRQRNLFITTNYKVMYSTLRSVFHLRPLNEVVAAPVLWLRRPHSILFVRNPYDRLVSTWADKFRARPLEAGDSSTFKWQKVQWVFLDHMGVDRSASDATIRETLLNVSFEQFVRWLPAVYRRDAHLHPQHWAQWLRPYGKLPILPVRIDRIIQIETMNAAEIEEVYGLPVGRVRRNSTAHPPAADLFTDELRMIARRLYEEDFRRFGYA